MYYIITAKTNVDPQNLHGISLINYEVTTNYTLDFDIYSRLFDTNRGKIIFILSGSITQKY